MSSYNTLSDSASAQNIKAVNAMLAAAQTGLSIDSARQYFAGFSGTARLVLRLAVLLRGHVAGVIAVGAGLGWELGGPETTFAADSTFAYFGAAGTEDFNYEEVLALGDRFRKTRVPSRVVAFEGEHSWPPAEVCSDALEWLELRAMLGGLRAPDSGWVRRRLAKELAQGVELERQGRWEEALRLDGEIASDYARWPEASGAAARAAALRRNPVITRYEAKAQSLAERDYHQGTVDLPSTLAWARAQDDPPTLEDLVRELRIPELNHAVQAGDSLEAASARRLLARIFIHLSFYEPRTYLATGRPAHAMRMFEGAATISPIRGEGCSLLRQARSAATAEPPARFVGQCTP